MHGQGPKTKKKGQTWQTHTTIPSLHNQQLQPWTSSNKFDNIRFALFSCSLQRQVMQGRLPDILLPYCFCTETGLNISIVGHRCCVLLRFLYARNDSCPRWNRFVSLLFVTAWSQKGNSPANYPTLSWSCEEEAFETLEGRAWLFGRLLYVQEKPRDTFKRNCRLAFSYLWRYV